MKKFKLFLLIFFIFFNTSFLPVKSDSIFEIGKDIFLNKGCAACHMLREAKSEGKIGPNLNDIRPSKIRVLTSVTNGIGVMPSYQDQLTVGEIEAVAHYVSKSANQ